MSIQKLVENIKAKGNPTVAGLDARLEYIPDCLTRRPPQGIWQHPGGCRQCDAPV